MNRENKRKTFEKGYYKNHPCNDSFTCKVCGRLVTGIITKAFSNMEVIMPSTGRAETI